MFAHPDFGPLQTREDFARSAERLLTPLVPFFNPEGSGICFGVEFGSQGPQTAALETFSRALFGLMPLLAGGGHFAETERWRRGIIAGTDPAHPGFWGFPVSCDQRQVEQPAIALSLALVPQIFWEPLTREEKDRVVTWLHRTNEVDIVDSNWRWFRVLVNACLRTLGERFSQEHLDSDLRRIDEFYLGEGWYRDENRVGDYYIPMAMHHYGLVYAKLAAGFDPERAAVLRERATRFAQDFVHWFAADGSAIPFGRSLIYRAVQGSFWGALAFADTEALPWGEIKGLILRHLRWWLAQPIFTESGLLTIGYRFPNPASGESYNCYGSPYWALKSWLPLALPENHPFWQAEELPLPARAGVSVQPGAGKTLCHDEKSGHVFALNQGQALEGWPRHVAHKYSKCVYSATFGFGFTAGHTTAHAGLDCTLGLSDDTRGRHFRVREKCENPTDENGMLSSVWRPWPDVEVQTWLVAALPGHLRIHRIRSGRVLMSADGGFAIDRHVKEMRVLSPAAPAVAMANREMGSAMIDLRGARRGEVIGFETGFHLMWHAATFPALIGEHPPGETWLVSYATGWPGSWSAEVLAAEAAGWEVTATETGVRVLRAGAEVFATG